MINTYAHNLKAAFGLLLLVTLLAAGCSEAPDTGSEMGETAVSPPVTTPADDPLTAPVEAAAPPAEDAAESGNPIETRPIIVETNPEPAQQDDAGIVESVALNAAETGLSETEIADLLFMREEEKLARDVYLALYELWGLNTFQNIAASEQSHMDAVLTLLNNVGLTDPVGSNGVGKFTNLELQALYNQLIAAGSTSLSDALQVGAAIEEIDILDLENASSLTTNPDILNVYASLRAGSENHLRSFVSAVERETGKPYAPQYLDATSYTAIMDATMSQGNGQGSQGSNNSNLGGGNQGNGTPGGGNQGNGTPGNNGRNGNGNGYGRSGG